MPPNDCYRIEPTTGRRLIADIDPAWVEGLPVSIVGFWKELEVFLSSQELLDVIVSKFSGTFATTRELRADQLAMAVAGRLPMSPRNNLVRDGASFDLRPHTDHPRKLISGIFYLAKDDSLAEFGTSIYVPKNRDLRAWEATRYPFENFDRVVTFPYLPNTLFLFAKSDISFHGVNPQHPRGGAVRRDTIFWWPTIFGAKGRGPVLSVPTSIFSD